MAKSKTKKAADAAAARLTDPAPRVPAVRPEDLLGTGCTVLNLAFSGRASGGVPKGTYVYFVGDSGSTKAQPLGAKVLTPTGWRLMGDLIVGDAVIDPDGGVAFVTGVYPQGFKDVFRVTLSDGSSTECCGEHLWLTATGNDLARGTTRIKNTQQIMRELENGAWSYIPFTRPVEFIDRPHLPLHPYVLGALLGDGCFTNHQVGFSSTDPEIVERIRSLLPDGCGIWHTVGCDYVIGRAVRGYDAGQESCWTHVSKSPRRGYGVYRCVCGAVKELFKGSVSAGTSKSCGCLKRSLVLDIVRSLGLSAHRSYDKFIPEIYLRSSVQDRLELLRGLMDTDGMAQPGRASFSTSSLRLRDDVCELVRSLGGRTGKVQTSIPTYSYKGVKRKGRLHYRLTVKLPDGGNPFFLTRKRELCSSPYRERLTRRVVSIVPSGCKECRCIAVSSARSLYVTDDYLVTHNTWLCFNTFAEAARNPVFDAYDFVFDNAEHGALFDVARYFGADVAARVRPPAGTVADPVYSDTVQQFYYHLAACCRRPCVYVLDSMDALNDDTDEEKFAAELKLYETGVGKVPGSMGMAKAKTNSQKINRVVKALRDTGSILIVISQTRDKVGGQFPGMKTRGGGRALRFFAHLEAWTSVRGAITADYHGKEREIGAYIQVDVQKNRVCGWEGKLPLIEFLKGFGVDDVATNVAYLIDEKHWGPPPVKKGEKAPPGRYAAPEFGLAGTRETLIQKIQAADQEWDLSKLVAQVWRDVRDNALPVRKARYT